MMNTYTVIRFNFVVFGDLDEKKKIFFFEKPLSSKTINSKLKTISQKDTENMGSKPSNLIEAADKGNLRVVKKMIRKGADVNGRGKNKTTALHHAAQNGHADVVKVLLQNGAKVNAVTTDGRTALHIACRYRAGDVANVLNQNGADVNAVSKDEGTALRIAAVKDNIPCTLQLLCFGAEIDEQTIEKDKTKLLRPIEGRLKSLRDGKRMEVSLMSEEERRFMWDLGFVLAVKHPTIAFTTYERIRSFVTFHGIFMGPGYDLGKKSIWRKVIH